MKKSCENCEKKNRMINMSVILLLILSIFILYSVQQYPASVNIPDDRQVNKYCKNKGFEMGWLNGDCGANKVTCYREVFNLAEYKCVRWGGKV